MDDDVAEDGDVGQLHLEVRPADPVRPLLVEHTERAELGERGDVLRDADPGRGVPEPLLEVHLQGDLDLHEAEERSRHAVLPEDAEQRHRDHVAGERVLARRDQRGELVEALEEHAALHGREPDARDLEQDRLEQPERRAALAAPVDRVAEVLPRHLDEGGHEAEEGGLDLARGLRGEGRHQRLEEDDEALDRLRRVAPRAAAAGLDEAVAALGEDGRGQVEKGPLRDRRLPGEDRSEKGGERLAVAAGARRALRGRRDGHPGVGDEPLELREEGRVERIVVGRVRDHDLLRAVYARRAPRATTVAARPRIRVNSARPPMKRLLRHLSQLLPALLSLGLLAWVLRSADVGRALGLVHSLGWRLPFLLLPNFAAFLAETGGWWLSFARLGPRPRFRRLLAVRVMVDALMLGLPSGSVVSETVQPYLLKRRCGVPTETGIVASVARKFFVVVSHGLFLGLSTLLAWPLLDQDSTAAIGRRGLPWLLLATSAVLVAAALGGVLATAHGRVADRVHRGLDRFGGRWLGSWLERNALRFQRTDEGLAAFFRQEPIGLVPSILLYVAGWFLRAVETWLFLRLVGVDVPLPAAMVIETALILVRAMAVPVPAGLGVQDTGYVLCLKALGVPDATTVGAAFVLLKRGKDLFWILLGFLLLGVGRRPGEAALAALPGEGAA